jgi:two-component system, cell cycle response regulator DivK
MSDATILVVDDNEINLSLARLLFEMEGYDVLTAEDAEQARQVIQERPPRLILMDLQLPGMSGLELTRLLKADPATRDIVILAVTAYAMKGDEERAIEAGCDGYISKPLNTRTLPGVVAQALASASQ